MDKTGKETLSIVEAAGVLGIGITTAYRAAKSGQIPTITIGGRRLVPKPALEEMLRCSDRRRHSDGHPQQESLRY